ncbi:MAG: hypothetical protein OEV08_14135 [Nitrospira sp.]|nr:hypothetical protein [Nitrospira sp.]
MSFAEYERLAEQHPDLAGTIQEVRKHLEKAGSNGLIRVHDVASFIGADPNQVRSVLEKLAANGLLGAEKMIECSHCSMAAHHAEFLRRHEEDGEYACTNCHRPLTHGAVRHLTAYRHQTEALTDILGPSAGAPARDGEPSQEVYCRVITHEGTSAIGVDAYKTWVARALEFDLFVDGVTRTPVLLVDGNSEVRKKLTPSEFAIVAEYMESRKITRPTATKVGSGKSTDTAGALFDNARRKVDIKVSRYEWTFFRRHKGVETVATAFEFAPPDGTSWCLIIPDQG